MTRRIVAILLMAVLACWAGLSVAQAPDDKEPVRLKKKAGTDKKEPATPEKRPAKDPAAKPENQPKDEPRTDEPRTPDEDEEVLLQRVAKNLKVAEEKLAKGDLGEATAQVQEDILKDLNALLKRS